MTSSVWEPVIALDGAPDPDSFREVFSHVPTSVAVVAGFHEDDGPCGLAVGTLVSVSLEPPLVSFCAATTSTSWPRVRAMGRFSANVLAGGQRNVVDAFAAKGGNKFAGVDWSLSPHGLPVLGESLATIECALEAEYETGDHTIVVGRVLAMRVDSTKSPMVFHRRGYGGVRGA